MKLSISLFATIDVAAEIVSARLCFGLPKSRPTALHVRCMGTNWLYKHLRMQMLAVPNWISKACHKRTQKLSSTRLILLLGLINKVEPHVACRNSSLFRLHHDTVACLVMEISVLSSLSQFSGNYSHKLGGAGNFAAVAHDRCR